MRFSTAGDDPDVVCIPRKTWRAVQEFWRDELENRFSEARYWWGGAEHDALWPQLLDLLVDEAECMEDMNPMALVDNFLVNSEIVDREGFCEDGEWEHYFQKYGTWDRLKEDAIVSDEKYALMQY